MKPGPATSTFSTISSARSAVGDGVGQLARLLAAPPWPAPWRHWSPYRHGWDRAAARPRSRDRSAFGPSTAAAAAWTRASMVAKRWGRDAVAWRGSSAGAVMTRLTARARPADWRAALLSDLVEVLGSTLVDVVGFFALAVRPRLAATLCAFFALLLALLLALPLALLLAVRLLAPLSPLLTDALRLVADRRADLAVAVLCFLGFLGLFLAPALRCGLALLLRVGLFLAAMVGCG